MPIKKEKQKNKHEIKPGDKVWWYNPKVIEVVINVNQTHAHVRNVHGVMEWVSLEKLHKVTEEK